MILFSGMRKGSVFSDGAPWHDDPCSYVEEKTGYKTVDAFAGKSCPKLHFKGATSGGLSDLSVLAFS
jgi:hypothetical protein